MLVFFSCGGGGCSLVVVLVFLFLLFKHRNEAFRVFMLVRLNIYWLMSRVMTVEAISHGFQQGDHCRLTNEEYWGSEEVD